MNMGKGQDESGAARKHVTTACKPCRDSKIKCDGQKPSCFNCSKKNRTCEYQEKDDKRRLPLRTAVEILHERVNTLSSLLIANGIIIPPIEAEKYAVLDSILGALDLQQMHQNMDDVGPISAPDLPVYEQQIFDNQTYELLQRHDSSQLSSYLAGTMPIFSSTSLDQGPIPQEWDSGNDIEQSFSETTPEWPWPAADLSLMQQVPTGFTYSQQLPPPTDTDAFPIVGSLHQSRRHSVMMDLYHSSEDETDTELINDLSSRLGSLHAAPDGRLRYYGTAANLHLVEDQQARRALTETRDIRHEGKRILEVAGVGNEVGPAFEQHLLDLYFKWSDSCFHVIDREMFETAKKAWENGEDKNDYYSEVLNNAMCAIGASFESRYHPTFITFPRSLAEFFADRCKALLEIELDSPCVATVQALVLLTSHDAAYRRDARSWLYSGMAMRLSFDLGIHIDSTTFVQAGSMTLLEAESRRVAFWGCFVVNHLLSFSLGRPFRIDTGEITVEKPILNLPSLDTAMPPPDNSKPPSAFNKPPLVGRVLHELAYLCETVAPLAHLLYGATDLSNDSLQEFSEKITDSLATWKHNLEAELRVDPDDEEDPALPHVIMLHMEYYQLQILIHRPWTSKSLQPSPQKGPGCSHARRKCIHAATRISKLLRQYEKQYTFRRLNVHIIPIIFSATLIMIFASVSRQADPALSQSNLGVFFRALDELGATYESAKTTREFLLAIQRRWKDARRASSTLKRTSETRETDKEDFRKRLKGKEVADPVPSSLTGSKAPSGMAENDQLRSQDERAWVLDFEHPSHRIRQR